MNVKSNLKKVIGSSIPIDLLEKLTEYSIWQSAPGFDLGSAREVPTVGTSWQEVVELGRERLWGEAVKGFCQQEVLFLEFGVWKGESISHFSGLLTSPGSRLFGFDSFEGLPEEWRGMKAGHFSTGGVPPASDDPRVTFVKGWFQESLPPRMQELASLARDRVVLVHLDADLYSSTLFVLYTLTQHIREFHFICDEFSGHELRALYNFQQASLARMSFDSYTLWRGCPTAVSGTLSLGAPHA